MGCSSSAAKAPKKESEPPEEETDYGYSDDPTLLLRSSQEPAPKSGAPNSDRKAQVTKEHKKPSVHAMRAALAHQVPLPLEDDEEYGPLDEYVDQLLGTSTGDGRPRPDPIDHDDFLRGEMPQIIFADGTRGPAPDLVKKREGNARAPDTPYLASLIERWSDVDAVALERARQGHAHRASQEAQREAAAVEIPKHRDTPVRSSYQADSSVRMDKTSRSDVIED